MVTSRYIIQNKSEYKENKLLLPLLIAFFFGLGVAFSMGGYDYSRFFAIALVAISFLLNIEDVFSLIMFAFPFSSMLKLTEDSISILPILHLVIIFKIISKNKFSVPPTSLLCFFVLAFMQTINIFLYQATFATIFSMLLNICFVLIVSHYALEHKESISNLLPKVSFTFATGTSIMLLLSDIYPHLPMLVHAEKTTAVEAAGRYAATVVDPNELAQIILIAIGLLIAAIPAFQSLFAKLLAIVMMVYMAITGIRTHSKSYAITILALFAFLMIVYIRHTAKQQGLNKTMVRLLPILLLSAVGFGLILTYVVVPVFASRSEEQTNFWTGRDNIWVNYLYALLNRLDVILIGCGAGNVTGIMRLVGSSAAQVPHNSYLEYVIQFGFIGLVLLFKVWKEAMASIKQKLGTFYVIPLVAFLITAFGISVNDNDCPFILMALLSLPLPDETTQPQINTSHK